MRPKLFDIRADSMPDDDYPLIDPWRRFPVDPEYAGAWVVAGDLDGDGEAELVSAKNNPEGETNEVTSVIATKLDGTVLWRWGDPRAGVARLGYDVACQVHDWDGDGALEVVVITRDTIVEIDGATGREKRVITVPKDAADCLTFVDLTGSGAKSEVLIKNRYERIWALDRFGKELWTCRLPGGRKTAHQVFPVDVDGDGREELIAGFAMLNPDGSLRWRWDDADELPDGIGCHLDCARVFRRGRTLEEWRIVLSCCAAERLAMIDGLGKSVWILDNHHFESIDICRWVPDIPGPQIVVDIGHHSPAHAPLFVYDGDGILQGKLYVMDSRIHFPIDWEGNGFDYVVVAGEATMFDGGGRKVARFGMPGVEPESELFCGRGDFAGGGVTDVVFAVDEGREIFIYRGENTVESAPGLPTLTGVNYTLY